MYLKGTVNVWKKRQTIELQLYNTEPLHWMCITNTITYLLLLFFFIRGKKENSYWFGIYYIKIQGLAKYSKPSL